VTAINNASLSTTSNTVQFYVCDYAKPVDILEPKNESDTSHEVVFTWDPNSVFFGYPCKSSISYSENLILYIERLNETINGTYPVIYSTGIVPGTKELNVTDDLKPEMGFVYQELYRWYMILSNGESTETSEYHYFNASILTCVLLDCLNGGSCANVSEGCICPPEYTGTRCEIKKTQDNLVIGLSVAAFIVASAIIGVIVAALIRKRRREARQRVVLKGPVKDMRFSNVKVVSAQGSLLSSGEMDSLRERLRDDAENGSFALSIAILSSTPSTMIDNTCKALLYAHHHDHNDVLLMKALIRREVSSTVKSDVIFRANTAATVTFKHFSKMIGLNYLFATLGKVIRDVIQKDADDAAVEERMKKDKNLAELMVMQDTCEVDPTKLDDDCGQDDLLSINSIQLTLFVQRFVKEIFQSADKMPAEFHEVMAELKNSVESAFPEAVQSALSAFLFLRFFNCGIAVPESYGLLEEPPNGRIRRSLVLVTKILTTMTSGAHFGDKEEFMTQFNEIIDKNQKELAAFYESVCTESEEEQGEFVDTPSDIYKNSMNVISCYEKEVKGAAQDSDE